MLGQNIQDKFIAISEGQIAWIMERETDEERLAAWEVFAAMACPHEDNVQYMPPKPKFSGDKLSRTDRVKRDAYNILRGIQRITIQELDRLRFQHGDHGNLTSSVDSSDEVDGLPRYSQDSLTFERRRKGNCRHIDISALSPDEVKVIEKWNRTIPDVNSLKEYLKKNYLYQNKGFVQSDEFCSYAYDLLCGQNWISTRTGKPLTSLVTAIFYIALDYKEKNARIKRLEKVEHAKDIKTDLEVLETEQDTVSQSDLAAIERRRRIKAEREEEERYLKGLK